MTIKDYLDKLNDGLGSMDAERRADVLLEMESHIDALRDKFPGLNEEEVVAKLSMPDQLARGILEGMGEHEDAKRTAEPADEDRKGRKGKRIRIPELNIDLDLDLDFDGFSFNGKKFELGNFLKGVFRNVKADFNAEKTFSQTISLTGRDAIAFKFTSADIDIEEVEGPDLVIDLDIEGEEAALEGYSLVDMSSDPTKGLFSEPSGIDAIATRATIKAPKGMKLGVKTASGDVRCECPLEALEVITMSGDVTVNDVNKLAVETKSGDIEVEHVGACGLESLSGDVRVHEVREIGVKTASGDVEIEGIRERVAATTASGDVSIEDAGGTIVVATASGDIEVEARDTVDKIEAKSASGDVSVRLDNSDDVDVKASTVSGDLDVFGKERTEVVKGSGRVLIAVSTVSGSIEID